MNMQTVFIAGATGYLGRFLCAHYRQSGWTVKALVRNRANALQSALAADEFVEAEATDADSLQGLMAGADLVISALGITRQKDGLGYKDVDYQANLNLLEEAMRAGVDRFAYIHVLNADKMKGIALVDAKQAFVEALQVAPIASTIIAPSGYFSDMADFLAMARGNRVWLFGDGSLNINPIHGKDLAAATFEAIAAQKGWLDVGGPDILTHREIAELAFQALGKPARITCLPDWIRLAALSMVRRLAPFAVRGPAEFFLTAFGQEMVGAQKGEHRLKDHFASLVR